MRHRSHRTALVALSTLALALLAAAGPAGAQAVKVKIGSSLSPPSLDGMTPYVAIERGFFKKQGLDVEVVEFRGDATSTKALLAGEVDAAIMGSTAAIVSASKGAKIRTWFVPQPVTPYHFVARKEAGTTLQALVGKNVGVSGIGAISYHIPRIVLERSGVDPEKLKYIAVGSPADRFKALVAGKIDACVVTHVEAAKLEKYPDVISLVVVPKVVPEIPYQFAVSREDYIEKNPETLFKLARALLEANRWMAANKAGTVEIAAKVIKGESPEVLGRAYDMTDPRLWGVNAEITEAAYKFTVDFLLKVGYMTEAVPYGKFFDRRFVDRALGEMGRM
jgi:NitT/TauT family transport system substrate-binding protein